MSRLSCSLSIAIITLLLSACAVVPTNWAVPDALLGNWKSEEAIITVRTSPEWMHFDFTADTITASISINPDKSVSGHIGDAQFSSSPIKMNPGNPEKTGISYIISCGNLSRIFATSPANQQELELWLEPITTGSDTLIAELRMTEGGGAFPMGEFKFAKTR